MLKNRMMKNGAEMIGRIKEAAGYQRKAVLALFPERTREHLEVIDGEIRSMITECAEAHKCSKDIKEGTQRVSKTKKVEII